MANICCCKYVFYTDDGNTDELTRLYKNLVTIIQPPEIKNDYEPAWLGNVATWHGIDWENTISCRGSIELLGGYELGNDYFTLYSDTAWSPTDELWEAVVTQYEGVSFVYVAEEPGMGIFTNTDSEGIYLSEKYLIEIYGNAPIPEGWYPDQDKPECLEIREYFSDFEELADYCTEFTGQEFSSIEELQSYFSDIFNEEDDTYASIHEFTAA